MTLNFKEATLIADRERRDGKTQILVRKVYDDRGFDYIGIRRFERAGNTWKPTSKGITRQANEFLDVMRQALEAIRESGAGS